MLFFNRQDAGKQLARKLQQYYQAANTVVVGLPRGGVVTAAVVAKNLQLPLDIIVTRKLGAPNNEELAIGAITEEGAPILNQPLADALGVDADYLAVVVKQQQLEARRRLRCFRKCCPVIHLHRKTVVLVDDGLATGYTMLAAIASAKAKGAKKIIVAVPVAPPDVVKEMRTQVDDVVTVATPEWFGAIGTFYQEFDQVTDQEVEQILSHQHDDYA